MVIDFHTHIYPDAMAHALMVNMCDKAMGHYAKGNLQGLLASMKHGGIDYSVTLPVATKPAQFDSINRFAEAQFDIPGIIPFGAIHPDCEDIPEKLKQLKSMGFKGIKLHPDYQRINADDPRYVYVTRLALEMGFIVVYHSGFNGIPGQRLYCTPPMAANLVNQLEDPGQGQRHKLIMAHNGCLFEHKDVMKYMMELPIYMDVSIHQLDLNDTEFMELVDTFGAENLLFGSDTPFQDQRWTRLKLEQRPLKKEQLEMIESGNAQRLLGMI